MTGLKLLHVTSSYPLDSGDSTAPFMEEMLGALAYKGHEVDVIVPQVDGLNTGARHGILVSGVRYAPGPLQVWGHGKSFTNKGRIRLSAIAISPIALTAMSRSLRRRVREKSPDVVHLHWVVPQGLLGLVLPRSQVVVLSLHGADARFFSGPVRPLLARALKRTDALVAASSRILDMATNILPEIKQRSFVIPHGGNDSLFGKQSKLEARTRLGIDESARIVLAVGRLVPKKGFSQLIRTLDLIDLDGVHLYIIGAGPEEAALRRSITAASEHQIHFIGPQRRPELAEWMSASDVLAIPSVAHRGEVDSGPVVLMEAMASGRPVVSTSVGMAEDVIEPGINGFLVDSNEPSRMAKEITRALGEADRLGRGARETFVRIGNWDRVAEQLEHVYQFASQHRESVLSK